MNRDKIKTIAVDIDGTLCRETCWSAVDCLKATPNQEMIDKVNVLAQTHFVIIYTARRDNLIPATLIWLRQHRVNFQAISNNKIGVDIYIDDKAINSNAFLGKQPFYESLFF